MKLTVANSGYDFRVMPTLSGWISFPGVDRAVLVQFHFHVPSEHTFNGQPQTVGEIHFLNVDAITGKRYVIAVLLRADPAENAALQPIFNQLPLHLCQKRITTIDFASILPSTITTYFRYVGSLTTPKCDGDVTFFVLPVLMPIGPHQLAALHQFGENARPPQPRLGRPIFQVSP